MCDGTKRRQRLLVATDLNQRVTGEGHAYAECRQCRTWFIAAIPADLARYYRHGYPAYRTPDEVAERLFQSRVDAAKIMVLGACAVAGARILELGPGGGGFFCRAVAYGYDMEAIEMDEVCCARLRDAGLHVHRSDDPCRTMPALGRFQAVVAWHVLEHLAKPREVLRQMHDSLVPGGAAVIAMPDAGGLHAKLFGARWLHLDAPRHLQVCPLRALITAAAAAGLRHERTVRGGFLNAALDRMGAVPAGLPEVWPIRGLITRTALWGHRLLGRLLRRYGRNDAYIAVFRRPA